MHLSIIGIAALVGLFLLRFGIPILIMAALTYFLRRLDARWEAEAQARRRAAAQQPQPGTQLQPGSAPPPNYFPEPALLDASNQPCWEFKNCDPVRREQCPAWLHPETSCWLARRRVEGRIPAMCYQCPLFAQSYGNLELPPESPPPVYH